MSAAPGLPSDARDGKITDHALLRFMERVGGVNLQAWESLMQETMGQALNVGDGFLIGPGRRILHAVAAEWPGHHGAVACNGQGCSAACYSAEDGRMSVRLIPTPAGHRKLVYPDGSLTRPKTRRWA